MLATRIAEKNCPCVETPSIHCEELIGAFTRASFAHKCLSEEGPSHHHLVMFYNCFCSCTHKNSETTTQSALGFPWAPSIILVFHLILAKLVQFFVHCMHHHQSEDEQEFIVCIISVDDLFGGFHANPLIP
jgi:hypothetical protein